MRALSINTTDNSTFMPMKTAMDCFGMSRALVTRLATESGSLVRIGDRKVLIHKNKFEDFIMQKYGVQMDEE